jgi:hypothetical protein
VIIKTCDEAIEKENDHLNSKVRRLELKVNKLKKQTKVQPPQDNSSNMVKKLEKERNETKITSQQQSKQVHHKKRRTLWMKRLNMQEVTT